MWMNGINSFFYVLSRNRFLQTIREDGTNQKSPHRLWWCQTHISVNLPFQFLQLIFVKLPSNFKSFTYMRLVYFCKHYLKLFRYLKKRSWFKFVIFRSEGAENWFLCFSILRRLKGWLHHKFIQILCFPFYLIEYQ